MGGKKAGGLATLSSWKWKTSLVSGCVSLVKANEIDLDGVLSKSRVRVPICLRTLLFLQQTFGLITAGGSTESTPRPPTLRERRKGAADADELMLFSPCARSKLCLQGATPHCWLGLYEWAGCSEPQLLGTVYTLRKKKSYWIFLKNLFFATSGFCVLISFEVWGVH